MVPTVSGTGRQFETVGLYDGLFVMQDVESKTLWNHITGDALYGPHVGESLSPVGNMLQMSAEQALAIDPNIELAISDRPYNAGTRPDAETDDGGRYRPSNKEAALSSRFIETLGDEDVRLPRMAMGLGVVSERLVRFYPMDLIEERGAFVDDFDGRSLLILADPTTFTPAALFVSASGALLAAKEVRLDTGATVRMGVLYDHYGRRLKVERPQQLFSRWYGFALTFPRAEIFGQ